MEIKARKYQDMKPCETSNDYKRLVIDRLQILVSQFDSGRCLQKNLVLVLKKSKLFFLHSSVAQLVEQLTVNQLVVGSSPTRGAKLLFNTLSTIMIIYLCVI